uniref:Uncharacterized protein n=1 Tax=Timema bartmani TaxID=61472 RepID=A0A7R9HZ40_9NEOP|nr:unnamed protein product [Timema bartmani]
MEIKINRVALALLLYLSTTSLKIADASLLDWFWSSNTSNSQQTLDRPTTLKKVPYELMTTDEKFLEDAKKFLDVKLSDLDVCQHKVVLKLRSSCITMSEEEVAKMSVKLLNCQSATEGRQQFPCTDDMTAAVVSWRGHHKPTCHMPFVNMFPSGESCVVVCMSVSHLMAKVRRLEVLYHTLKECTSPMDAIMWNTYHLMNNRALAVCHSVKNMQFRALNEMTVNKLMTAAHDQLASMESLKESQVKVQTMTSNTLESVAKNNTVLMSQQDKLFSMQHNIKDFVALNLRELTREKALIAAGHQEIAKLTADIKKSVELTSVSAATQRVEWQENHKELLLQIDKIKNNINAVLDGIELRTQLITSHNDMVTTHHKVLMENLAKINGTVNFLLNIVDRSRDEFNARLGWIASRVTGTADSLDQVYIFALHGAYLIVGMIISSFVNVPNFTRMFLLLMVILNVILSLQKGPYSPMDFFTITVLMFASIAVQLFVQTAQAYFGPKNLAALTYSTKSNSPKNSEHFVPPANPTQSRSVSNFFKEHVRRFKLALLLAQERPGQHVLLTVVPDYAAELVLFLPLNFVVYIAVHPTCPKRHYTKLYNG